tara:strand:+ start:484 stop:651 length:168 start_codon:yes stop_codon:yes gene_type:complete
MDWKEVLKHKRSTKRGKEWRSKTYQRDVAKDKKEDELSNKVWNPETQSFEEVKEE